MSSLTPYVLALWIGCALVLAISHVKYNELNKKFGSKLKPGGHPFGWVAITLQIAQNLALVFKMQPEIVLSALSIFATVLWLALCVRDLRKSQTALANAPAPIAHEGIPGWGLALKGLNEIYIDLSGIDTKTLVDSKIDIENLKTRIADKLRAAGIEVAATKASAKCWLTMQMKTQSGPRETGSITTLYMQIGETYTNERLDAISVRVNAPIFSTVTVAVCDGTPSAEGLTASFEERLEQFIQERKT